MRFGKCIHSKKHPTLKGYCKCEIKGTTMTDSWCDGWFSINNKCSYYRKSLIDRIFDWLDEVAG